MAKKKRKRTWEKRDQQKYRGAREFIDAFREVFQLAPLYGAKGASRASYKLGQARRFVQDSVEL